MSITRVDLEREQRAHAETRAALEAARDEVTALRAKLRAMPTKADLDKAKRQAAPPAPKTVEVVKHVVVARPEDHVEIARLRALVDLYEREAKEK